MNTANKICGSVHSNLANSKRVVTLECFFAKEQVSVINIL